MDKAGFLKNLTRARKSRGYTQKEAAEALGVSDKTYSKWETGENEPDIGALCRLGSFYGEGPAAFFREKDDPGALEGLPPAEASEAVYRRVTELLLSLRSAAYPAPGEAAAPLPCPEMPKELRMPNSDRNLWFLSFQDLLALIAAGPDANFAMLMLPHAERYRWLITEGAHLEELFRLLGMPGAVRCLFGMLTEAPGALYSPDYLAEKVGITEAEAAAFLAAARPWQFAAPYGYLREEGSSTVYFSELQADLLGLLTLGRVILSQDIRREDRRGGIASGSGSVHLHIPKGEEP